MERSAAELLELASCILSRKRFLHTLRVTEWAEQLAKVHGIDEGQARTAGLAHDLAKGIPPERQVRIAENWGLIRCPEDRANPDVLHGPIAAYWLEHNWGIEEKDVLAAVAHHTLGAPGMSRLEMLIYSADLTEAGRPFPEVDKLRRDLYDNLERGTLACVIHTLRYLEREHRPIHPQTKATYEDLKRRLNIGTSDKSTETGC